MLEREYNSWSKITLSFPPNYSHIHAKDLGRAGLFVQDLGDSGSVLSRD